MSATKVEVIPFYIIKKSSELTPGGIAVPSMTAEISMEPDHWEFMQRHADMADKWGLLWRRRGVLPLHGKKRIEFYHDKDYPNRVIKESISNGFNMDEIHAILCGKIIDQMRHLGMSLTRAYLAQDVHEYRLVFQED